MSLDPGLDHLHMGDVVCMPWGSDPERGVDLGEGVRRQESEGIESNKRTGYAGSTAVVLWN